MGKSKKGKKAPKGSKSEKVILKHARRGMELLTETHPRTMSRVQKFMKEAMNAKALSRRDVELVLLGMALVLKCPECIGMHVEACKAAKIPFGEIADILPLAVMMGGGPVLTGASAQFERACNEFYLDDEGEPLD